MRVDFWEQYGIPCVVIDSDDEVDFETVYDAAIEADACCIPPGENEDHFCVQFPGRPMELYTELALSRTFGESVDDE